MLRTRLAPLALAAAALAVALLLAELLLAWLHPVGFRRPAEPVPGDLWRNLLHQPSPVPGLAYELAPSREAVAGGVTFRTNRYGMRYGSPGTEGPKSRSRIVVVGDSFTFGFGVEAEDSYPSVLEEILGPSDFHVLNLGVGGYSARDAVLALEHKGMSWDPVLVVVGYVLNDPEIEPIQPLHRHYEHVRWWQRSNLLRLLASARHRLEVRVRGRGDYYRYLHHPDGAKWKSVEAAFARIAELTRGRGVPALVVIFPMILQSSWAEYPNRDLHQQVAELAHAHGLHVLDLYETFSSEAVAAIRSGPGDAHPSARGHALAAMAIRQWMIDHQRR
ncbi:MAG: SGNH/GDSL hydrolase family protein [Myxococcota bacterium]